MSSIAVIGRIITQHQSFILANTITKQCSVSKTQSLRQLRDRPLDLCRQRFFHGTVRKADGTLYGKIQKPSAAPEPEPAPKVRQKRSPRILIWAAGFFFIGTLGGSFVKAVIIPPPLPKPDSPEDEFMKAKIRKDIDKLPLVQELRTKRGEWLEYDAYMALSPEVMESHMTAGTMRGFGGLGIQKVFWNKEEKRLISVVFFGGALSGWPGITHGGIIATVLQENLERVANGPDFVQSTKGEVGLRSENLNIKYLKPTGANALHVVRAEIDDAADGEVVSTSRVSCKATLEDAHNGKRTASATGYCSKGDSIILGSAKQEATSIWQSITSIFA